MSSGQVAERSDYFFVFRGRNVSLRLAFDQISGSFGRYTM